MVLTLVLALAGSVSAVQKSSKHQQKNGQCTAAMAEHCTKEMAAKCEMKDQTKLTSTSDSTTTTENGAEHSCCKVDKKIARQKSRHTKAKSVASTSCCDGGSCCFSGSPCCTTHKA